MIRTDVTNAIKRESYKWFIEKYDPVKMAFNEIFDVQPWHEAYRQETSAFGTGLVPEKAEGEAFQEESAGEAFSPIIRLRSYGYKVSITRETQDHSKRAIGDLLKEITKDWAPDTMNTKDNTCALMFVNGGIATGNSIFNGSISGIVTDPSGALAYDSEPMFNLTGDKTNRHAKAGTTTYYNADALALSATNAETMYNLMTTTNNRDEKEEVVEIIPTHLVHGAALTFTARRILESTNIPGSAENDTNVLQSIVKDLPWQRITDTDAWAFVTAKKGLVMLIDVEPEIDVWIDDVTKNLCASLYFSFGPGLLNWRFLAGSNWADS